MGLPENAIKLNKRLLTRRKQSLQQKKLAYKRALQALNAEYQETAELARKAAKELGSIKSKSDNLKSTAQKISKKEQETRKLAGKLDEEGLETKVDQMESEIKRMTQELDS